MANIKVSELNEASLIDDNDLLMIVQNNENKKIKGSKIKVAYENNGEYYLKLNNNIIVKEGTDGSTFVAGDSNNVVLRPNGHNSSVGQAILSTAGNLTTNNIDGVILKGKAGITTATITSLNGYGIVLIVSSQFVCVLELGKTNVAIHDIYGTHGTMNATINNGVVTITGLYNWDHYIFIGSNAITNIT